MTGWPKGQPFFKNHFYGRVLNMHLVIISCGKVKAAKSVLGLISDFYFENLLIPRGKIPDQ